MARPQRLHSINSGVYNETVKHVVLMCSNVMGNNNKFYSLELQKSSSGLYCLFSHYGRISGDTISGGVLERRDGYHNEYDAEHEFNSIIKKKKRGKTVTKNGQRYKEQYKEIDIISSSVGSSNVKNSVSVVKNSKKRIDTNVFNDFGTVEANILKILEEENIHDITNSTTMTYTSNGLQTPLGPLTMLHLSKARNVLDNINNELKLKKNQNKLSDSLKLLNNEYLSLIPRNMGNNISDSQLIATGDKILNEYDLLQQMETAIQMSKIKDTDDKDDFDLGFKLELVSGKVFEDIKSQVEKTRKHTNLSHLKVKRVYQVENFKERSKYESFADGLLANKPSRRPKGESVLNYKEVDLFHGSKNSNILSILMNGIYVPPSNASHVTGRMFGNGVYGADSSTKALNYSAGFWDGRRNKNKSMFCFVMRFALGRVYETKHSLYSGTPSGYNSIYAKGGADLKNNEYIVPNPSQTTMSYLIEFE